MKVTFVLYDPQLPKARSEVSTFVFVTGSFESEDEYETLAE
jgi:hypothetical protein